MTGRGHTHAQTDRQTDTQPPPSPPSKAATAAPLTSHSAPVPSATGSSPSYTASTTCWPYAHRHRTLQNKTISGPPSQNPRVCLSLRPETSQTAQRLCHFPRVWLVNAGMARARRPVRSLPAPVERWLLLRPHYFLSLPLLSSSARVGGRRQEDKGGESGCLPDPEQYGKGAGCEEGGVLVWWVCSWADWPDSHEITPCSSTISQGQDANVTPTQENPPKKWRVNQDGQIWRM